MALLLSVLVALTACGGGDGGDSSSARYMVGGSVTGLVGSGLVLQNNAGDDLAVSGNGTFTFATSVAHGAAYAVTVETQPSVPAQTCTVANGSGTIAAVDITTVTVTCQTNSGRFAYVANGGDNTTGSTLSAYTIDATNGSLAPIAGSPFSTGVQANEIFALAVSPSGKFLAVADGGGGTVLMYAIDATSGALTAVTGSPFATEVGGRTGGVAFDKTGSYLYATNYATNNVTAYSVNASTGVLTRISGSPFVTGSGPIELAFGAGGKYVFITNLGTDLNGTPLALTNSSGSLSEYSLNASTGALVQVTGSPLQISGNGFLATNSAGDLLYVPVLSGLSSYSVNASNGALTLIAGSPYILGAHASEVTLDRSGKFVYVTNTDDATVTGYAVTGSTGALTLIPGSPVATGLAPYNIVTD